jgi:GNAT superfamily N-acetyltransferase
VVSPRASKIDYDLAALVNSVYALAEDGLWADSTPRTTPARMAELIAAGYIAVARADERIIGVVQIQRLDTGKGELGMLVADPAHRGQGVGRELVRFAERWSREQGSDTMQLEVPGAAAVVSSEQGVPEGLVHPHRLPPGADRAVRGELSRARPAPRDTLRLRHLSQELADLAGP